MLWVQHLPADSSLGDDEHWFVWAKSPSGKLFKVIYFLSKDAAFHSQGPIRPVSESDLARALVGAGEVERAKIIGLSVVQS